MTLQTYIWLWIPVILGQPVACYTFSHHGSMRQRFCVINCPFISSTVGNIPYEATEEQLKEIFLQAGPVVSFR